MKVSIYGINYEYTGSKNIWTVKASIRIDGHLLIDKAVFTMPYAVRSFEEAEVEIRDLLRTVAV